MGDDYYNKSGEICAAKSQWKIMSHMRITVNVNNRLVLQKYIYNRS